MTVGAVERPGECVRAHEDRKRERGAGPDVAGGGFLPGTGGPQLPPRPHRERGRDERRGDHTRGVATGPHGGRDVADGVQPETGALCLEALAWIAASRNQAARAAELLGAAIAAWSSIPAALPGPLARHREDAEGRARSRLGDASFTAHLVKAQAMPPSRTVAAAFDEQARTVQQAPASSDQPQLTAREREVAALIAEGLSNPDIAARLVISARTAETHVQHIMVKLGLTARAQIAAWSAAET